jgi:hypothetical protein
LSSKKPQVLSGHWLFPGKKEFVPALHIYLITGTSLGNIIHIQPEKICGKGKEITELMQKREISRVCPSQF